MSEALATAPQGEIATPTPEAEAPVSLPDPRDYAPEGAPEPEPEPQIAAPEPPEEIEFDLGGTKVKAPKTAVPPEVAEALQKWTKAAWSNHTQRSQELAELRKRTEAEFQQAQQFRRLDGELRDKFSRGYALRQELDQWRATFNPELWQTNPSEAGRQTAMAQRMEHEIQRIAGEVHEAEVALAAAERERATRHEQEQLSAMQRAAEEGREIVRKAVPTFDAKAEADLISYAVKSGVPEAEARNWSLSPHIALAFWKAMQWERAQAAGSAAIKPVPPSQPVKGLAPSGATTPTDPAHMSTEQMAAHLKAQGIIR